MNEICKYINYIRTTSADAIFVKAGGKKIETNDGIEAYQMSYPKYVRIFDDFVSTACKYFDDHNYRATIANALPDLYKKHFFDTAKKQIKRYKSAIAKADKDTLSALWTQELRAERFCDGNWISCQKNGIWLALVERLLELENSGIKFLQINPSST